MTRNSLDTRGFAGIACQNPKDLVNIGAVLRAAHCYRASMVAFAGQRPRKLMRLKNAKTDTMQAWRHVPCFNVDEVFDALPYGATPVAVDLVPGAIDLPDFVHPVAAYYIFGPEDGTLGKTITERCVHKIKVPTRDCMNLAATVNVVLYDRMAKEHRSRPPRLPDAASQPHPAEILDLQERRHA